ncbi:C-type lectin lectoxin-Phi1-like [Boleophthalmus pectinirostris]|uniref:C-type lectin lectoxin-Phi1-like n=1 Tax=Boleophthalmus pectinirostris TaxID=150288 RepID=UPI00242CF1BF|nr:C-type lectin lectoxin-Phi1-like [Boleophthalmus pectinirostris]
MTSDSNSWRWSSTGLLPGGYQSWAPGEPNYYQGKEWCVFIRNGVWLDAGCASSLYFFCYDVDPSGLKQYILITSPMTWSNAQSYCRQNHHDLAMIESSAENQAVTNLLPTTTSAMWIGLYRIPWRWSNGSLSTYRNWASGQPSNSGGSEFCASQTSSYVWNDAPCSLKYTFVCYAVVTTSANVKMTLQTTASMSDTANRDKFLHEVENHLGFGYSPSWRTPPSKKEKKSLNDVCTAKF